MVLRKLVIYTALAFAAIIATAPQSALYAQKNKGPAEKSISGTVTKEDGTPVEGAVVQLKNLKSLQIRSFISTDKGQFFFNGLGTDADYEVTAKSADGKLTSNKRTLSAFDSRPAPILNLTIK